MISIMIFQQGLLFCFVLHVVNAFFPSATTTARSISRPFVPTTVWLSAAAANNDATIDFQSDTANFGRGEMHLSAMLEEGDVVVYQTGTWWVDGVTVGTGSPPGFAYARMETIQIVWTHNCEHGVLRGVELELEAQVQVRDDDSVSRTTQLFKEAVPLEAVEFGPDQLVARLPVTWNDETNTGISAVPLNDSIWQEHGMID
jgi:hypothetical protein